MNEWKGTMRVKEVRIEEHSERKRGGRGEGCID